MSLAQEFGSTLSPPSSKGPKRLTSTGTLRQHSSSASLRRVPSQALDAEHGDGPNHRISLAHELAAALMPQPSMTSRLLADEFGLEFDEGAEGGIEEEVEPGESDHPDLAPVEQNMVDDDDPFGDPNGAMEPDIPYAPAATVRPIEVETEETLALLTKDLATTETFIANLRRIDVDTSAAAVSPRKTSSGHVRHGSMSQYEQQLEALAGDVIRRINETTREREGQVRELAQFEREFRKIAGEVGGQDVLGELDELESFQGLGEKSREVPASPGADPWGQTLDDLAEEPEEDEDDTIHGAPPSPTPRRSSSLLPPPAQIGPATPASALPELAHVRELTQSLIGSLTAVSEHAQVNGAGAADAGRKLRALRNKLGGWKVEWESAERSRLRIERWEREGVLAARLQNGAPPRLDAKRMVEEQLSGFERALSEANSRTQAIMAAS